MMAFLIGIGLFIGYAIVGALIGSAIAVPAAMWGLRRYVIRANAQLKAEHEADCRRVALCGIRPPPPPIYWSLK